MVSGLLMNNFGLAGFLPWGWASGHTKGFISPQDRLDYTGFEMSCLADLRGFCYSLLLSSSASFCVQCELPGHGWFHPRPLQV